MSQSLPESLAKRPSVTGPTFFATYLERMYARRSAFMKHHACFVPSLCWRLVRWCRRMWRCSRPQRMCIGGWCRSIARAGRWRRLSVNPPLMAKLSISNAWSARPEGGGYRNILAVVEMFFCSPVYRFRELHDAIAQRHLSLQ